MTVTPAAPGSEPAADWVHRYPAEAAARHHGVVVWLRRLRCGHVYLARLVVPEGRREQGIGTAVMTALLAVADAHDDTVICVPSIGLGAEVRRLRAWHRRFGFVSNTGRNRRFDIPDSMYRRPGAQAQQARVITPPSTVTAVHDSAGRTVAELPAEAAGPDGDTRQLLVLLHDLGLRVSLDRGHWITRRTVRLTFGAAGTRTISGDLLIHSATGRLRRGSLKLPWRQVPIPLATPTQWRDELDRHAAVIRRHMTVAGQVRPIPAGHPAMSGCPAARRNHGR